MKVFLPSGFLISLKTLLKSFFVFCLLFSSFSAVQALELKKGISLHNWFSWPGGAQSNSGDFNQPVFSRKESLSDNELKRLRSLGFDFVRLTVDPAPFIYFTGDNRIQLLNELQTDVKRIRAAGLNVLIDMHPKIKSQHSRWNSNVLTAESGGKFNEFVDVVDDFTKHFSSPDYTSYVAFELLNEPDFPCNSSGFQIWDRQLKRLYDSARKGSSDITLVIPGTCIGKLEGLVALDIKPYLNNPNNVFTFHYYEPFIFTHQGSQASLARYFAGIPYPFNARAKAPIIKNIEQRIKGLDANGKAFVRKLYTDYFNNRTNRDTLRADITKLSRWATANKVPRSRILMGEFGVIKPDGTGAGANPEDRARWVQDVRELAENAGIGWAFWNYNARYSPGMNFVLDDKTRQPDPTLVRALGLSQ